MSINIYNRTRFLPLLVLAVLLGIVVACDQPRQEATTRKDAFSQNPTIGATQSILTATITNNYIYSATLSSTPVYIASTATLSPTNNESTPISELTRMAYENAYATSEAESLTRTAPTAAIIGLTTTAIAAGPTRTPMPIFPTPTVIIGLYSCDANGYYANNCWTGFVNGQLVGYMSGRGHGEQTASLLMFMSEKVNDEMIAAPDSYYYVPCDVDDVGIASVNGTLLVLVPYNQYRPNTPTPAPTPIVLVFDMATRQWVSSTCGPLPDATPTLP